MSADPSKLTVKADILDWQPSAISRHATHVVLCGPVRDLGRRFSRQTDDIVGDRVSTAARRTTFKRTSNSITKFPTPDCRSSVNRESNIVLSECRERSTRMDNIL